MSTVAFITLGLTALYVALLEMLSSVQPVPVGSVLAAVIAFVSVVATQRIFSANLSDALSAIGFRRTSAYAIGVALLGALPILSVYAYFGFVEDGLSTRENWLFWLLKFVIAQGLWEECLFRGFAYGRLRDLGYSFYKASSVAAVLFGAVHLFNIFSLGISAEAIFNISVSVTFGFLVTFAACAIYEIAGRSIFPFAIVHILIDGINLLPNLANQAYPLPYIPALLISCVLLWASGRVVSRRL